jgi:hypothetical protein
MILFIPEKVSIYFEKPHLLAVPIIAGYVLSPVGFIYGCVLVALSTNAFGAALRIEGNTLIYVARMVFSCNVAEMKTVELRGGQGNRGRAKILITLGNERTKILDVSLLNDSAGNIAERLTAYLPEHGDTTSVR